MADLHRFDIDLEEKQFKKMVNGKPVQLKPHQLNGNKHHLMVSMSTHKKMSKAKRLGKGIRLNMSDHELEHSAEGIKDFIKKAVDFYQKNVKPVAGKYIREGLDKAAQAGLTALEVAVPEASPLIEVGKKNSRKLINFVGDKTGAYGLPSVLSDNYSNLIGPMHPSMHPVQLKDSGGNIHVVHHVYHNGGSFNQA